MFFQVKQFLMVFFVALAPTIALLLRGVLWGADSFAFLSVSCGNPGIEKLGHPFFAQFVPLFNCNFYLIITVMFFFYFFSLISLWFFGNYLFKEKGYLLPIVVGSISPLFFIEALRFENQLFGVTLSLIALALFTLYLSHHKSLKGLFCVFLAIIMALFSVLSWFPSLFILAIAFFLLEIKQEHKQTIFLIGLIFFLIFFGKYFFWNSISQLFLFPNDLVSENMPFVGLVFILHIISFYKYVDKKFFAYSLFLIFLGLINLKYVFLASILLGVGLVNKEISGGIQTKQGRIPLLPIAFLCLIGLTITSLYLFPTQSDVKEIDFAIQFAKDNNIVLVNDWGVGWLIESRGYQTKYKISRPNPDFNKIDKPFVAYTKKSLDCEQLTEKVFNCS